MANLHPERGWWFLAAIVLVHGSWHGGWCWQRVAPLLRQAGHEVWTPTLTGLAERRHLLSPEVDLRLHTRDVTELLAFEGLRDVILVGHSYAGMVIASVAAAEPERLHLLVYLDAYLPKPGETEIDLWPPEEIAAARRELEEPLPVRPPASPAWLGITDAQDAAWVASRLTAHPLRTYAQPVPPGGEGVPGVYVRCMEGPLVERFASSAARARERGWPVIDLQSGHDAMVTAPEELARLLDRCASEP